MIKYQYKDIVTEPDLLSLDLNDIACSGIEYDIENSEMTNKAVEYCRWDEETSILIIVFDVELSISDKNLLDDIVEKNI